MKIFFLLNPSRPKQMWDLREAAGRAARRHGATARFGQVERGRSASSEHLIRQAWEEECSRLVVIGGDGTLHGVLNTLHRQRHLSAMELAIVPAGTCNDFARGLGLSRRRIQEALRAACAGEPRAVDLARMNGELFINNAGFGRQMPASPAKRRVKPLRTLRHFEAIPLRARWEKGSIEGSFFMGLACNAPFFSGGLHFSKNVRLNDGLLDVHLLPRVPKWKLVPLLMMGRLGRSVRWRQMITLRVPRLEIEAEKDLWPQADGEPPSGPVRRLTFSIAEEKAMIVVSGAPKAHRLWT